MLRNKVPVGPRRAPEETCPVSATEGLEGPSRMRTPLRGCLPLLPEASPPRTPCTQLPENHLPSGSQCETRDSEGDLGWGRGALRQECDQRWLATRPPGASASVPSAPGPSSPEWPPARVSATRSAVASTYPTPAPLCSLLRTVISRQRGSQGARSPGPSVTVGT